MAYCGGKPSQNGYIESFNGRLHDECLNANWFLNRQDARRKITVWQRDYNQIRPHSALEYRSPLEFAGMVPFAPPTVNTADRSRLKAALTARCREALTPLAFCRIRLTMAPRKATNLMNYDWKLSAARWY